MDETEGDKRVTEVHCALTPYPVSQPPVFPDLAKPRQNLALNLFVAWSKTNLLSFFFFLFVENNLKVASLSARMEMKSMTAARDYYD